MQLNVVVGIVGAFAAGWLVGPQVGQGSINSGDFGVASFAVSLLGAVILLVLVNLVRREGAR